VLLKFGWGKFVLRHSIVVAAIAVVPVVATIFARKLAAMRVVAMQKQATALQEKKLKLISRIKVELPMKEALELLLRYDPQGDHKARVETGAWGQADITCWLPQMLRRVVFSCGWRALWHSVPHCVV
jgi:hypothetical protein